MLFEFGSSSSNIKQPVRMMKRQFGPITAIIRGFKDGKKGAYRLTIVFSAITVNNVYDLFIYFQKQVDFAIHLSNQLSQYISTIEYFMSNQDKTKHREINRRKKH